MKNQDFKPYIPAEKITQEFTLTAVITGVLISVIFGAANAYLGLRMGTTISASIPAAVLSMGIIRKLMRRNSILENNMVQTIGSAGESVAAGAIFTLPAVFLWAHEGLCDSPGYVQLALISLCGGVLGVLFMIPLRRALIVKEHAVLPYPEGTACAHVLMTGEKSSSKEHTAAVFTGMGFAAAVKFIIDGLNLVSADISLKFQSFKGELGVEIYPALMGVGYIVGPRMAFCMLAGSVLAWMGIIPLICMFGGDVTMYPVTDGSTISELFAASGASAIWRNYVKYIGAGAIATGGLISLIKSSPLIVRTFRDSMKSMWGSKEKSVERTSDELPMGFILIGIALMLAVLILSPSISVGLVGAFLILIFGFFFATVSSRMVGIVGSTNNPASGMTIATLLLSASVFKLMGNTDIAGMCSVITITGIICTIATVAGDTSQDLKTGYLLGATPKKQQVGELIGVASAAVAIGGVLYVLDSAWGFGSAQLPAPQATLMKLITEGIMSDKLPWNLILIGVFIALACELARIPVMPFALGIYLPIYLIAGIAAGGFVRAFIDKQKAAMGMTEDDTDKGTLFCAGMVAGEGLVGILLAVFTVVGLNLDISGTVSLGDFGGLAVFVAALAVLIWMAWSKKSEAAEK